MDDEIFKKDLDELFRLFRRLVKDRPIDEISGVNSAMLKQFEFFFSNYETMKDQLSTQLQGAYGPQVREMVKMLITQLKDELGEDDLLANIEQEEIEDEIVLDEELIKIEGKSEKDKIDELLQTPGLSEEQINELLDRRAEL